MVVVTYLNSKTSVVHGTLKFNVTSAGKQIRLPSGFRGSMFVHDAGAAGNGFYFISATSSGGVRYKEVSAVTGLTIDASTANILNLSATSSTSTFAVIIVMIAGTATEV